MNRETAAKRMETIHDDLRNTYIQDDLFWQFQDVVRENGTLADSQNVFLYWVNTLFKDSIIMAVRRQIDRDEHCVSLRRLLAEFRDDPALAGGRFTVPDIQTDIDSLDERAQIVRGFADRRVAHADPRQLGEGRPTFRDVRNCLEEMCGLVNKYAATLCEPPLTPLPPTCGTTWREIFTFPWVNVEDNRPD
jgi:hypothetical protein